MGHGQHGDRCFDQQRFGVQSAHVVGRAVQERRVSLPFAQHACAVAAEDDLDRQHAGFALVGREDRREQARVAAGFHGQEHARVPGAGTPGPRRRGGDRVQRRPCLAGEHLAGRGQRHRTAGPWAGSAGAAGAALRNWALALDRALAGNGVHVGYLGLGAWLVGTPGMPEDASPMEPDEVARVLWDMHSGRNPAERLITP